MRFCEEKGVFEKKMVDLFQIFLFIISVQETSKMGIFEEHGDLKKVGVSQFFSRNIVWGGVLVFDSVSRAPPPSVSSRRYSHTRNFTHTHTHTKFNIQ